jgi:tRNA(fMet)-specific endonuclease VapC
VTYQLDTTAVSALMRADPKVAARLRALPPRDVAVAQPVLAEIHHGLSRLPRSRRKLLLEDRWGILVRSLGRAQWTDAVSRRYGELKWQLEKRGTPLDDFDLAIAAHALESQATLVTSNVKHFGRVPGLEVEDWERG